MTATEFLTFAGIAAVIIATQIGHHPLTARRILIPFVVVAVVAYNYLHGIPTAGGDLDFDILLSLAGAAFGVLAGLLIRVEREASTGRIMLQAGLGYAAVWVIVFGGRLAFAEAATTIWKHEVAAFSIQHAITGGAAWTAAFILMALSMVFARTAVVGIRALLAAHPLPARAPVNA